MLDDPQVDLVSPVVAGDRAYSFLFFMESNQPIDVKQSQYVAIRD